jgi:RND superfamily putative drug exporter
VTGLDALRASAGESHGDGAGVMLGTLLAALGALLVLAFVFRSFMAFVPLLMALVAIPTTFLLVWPLASVTNVSVIVQYLVALIGRGLHDTAFRAGLLEAGAAAAKRHSFAITVNGKHDWGNRGR